MVAICLYCMLLLIVDLLLKKEKIGTQWLGCHSVVDQERVWDCDWRSWKGKWQFVNYSKNIFLNPLIN